MKRSHWIFLVVALLTAASIATWVWTSTLEDTRAPIRDGGPSWSPDGSRIAFHSSRTGGGDIYVMNADGSGVRQLTDHPASDGSPSWSPDGKQILFDSKRSGNFDIWVMNADGTGSKRLTRDPGRDLAPSWSPDGSKIAYMSDRVGAFQVYVMNADGAEDRRMTMVNTNWFPQWSPDGKSLAFHVRRDVHVLSVDATSFTRLTRDPDNGMYPSWSPTGDRIVFMSWRGGPTEVYVMNADGTNQARLTHTEKGDAIDPRWSPDGARIAYVHVPEGRDGDGPQVICTIGADGRDGKQLTGR